MDFNNSIDPEKALETHKARTAMERIKLELLIKIMPTLKSFNGKVSNKRVVTAIKNVLGIENCYCIILESGYGQIKIWGGKSPNRIEYDSQLYIFISMSTDRAHVSSDAIDSTFENQVRYVRDMELGNPDVKAVIETRNLLIERLLRIDETLSDFHFYWK